jgi:hypothetical protein
MHIEFFEYLYNASTVGSFRSFSSPSTSLLRLRRDRLIHLDFPGLISTLKALSLLPFEPRISSGMVKDWRSFKIREHGRTPRLSHTLQHKFIQRKAIKLK